MDVNAIFNAIGSIGFPIVVAVYMIWVNQKQQETHKSEVKDLTDAINDMKLVFQQLLDKLENK